MIDEATIVQQLVLVTGPSGAGRSTAINALEDIGFEAIDNIPLSLIPRLLDAPATPRPLALGVDARNRDFDPEALARMHAELQTRTDVQAELLYLDCARDVLVRRFSETRRRHPLSPGASVLEGIAEELRVMEPLRVCADILIETSDLSPHELGERIRRLCAPEAGFGLAVSVQSFSYKRGLPSGADVVLDGRFLNNPHWEPDLRPKTGQDPAVAAYVRNDPRYAPFFQKVVDLAMLLLPACRDEGKTHFSIAFGCTGGRHRSVALAEALRDVLAEGGWRVSIRHRELERQGGPATALGSADDQESGQT